MNTATRNKQRLAFLLQHDWGDADIAAQQPDASFRCYFRLTGKHGSAMLMDAPPPREQTTPFLTIARHLKMLGLHPPEILAEDVEHGFILLEDFGTNTFTRLLASGAEERRLYERAVDELVRLHQHPRAVTVDVPKYDLNRLLDEAALMVDWYLPAVGVDPDEGNVRARFLDAWRDVISGLPNPEQTLVLRDYHVDNLMMVARDTTEDVGLLDFQDAVIGSSAYDLASLLEDARRDIDADLFNAMLDRYHSRRPELDRQNFDHWFHVLGAQRHAKVAGIFVRLCARDGKEHYLKHMPRVIRLLQRNLRFKQLGPVKEWVQTFVPSLSENTSLDIDAVRRRNQIEH